MAVAAAAKLHSYDGQVVLHSCRFHSRALGIGGDGEGVAPQFGFCIFW